MSKTIIIYFSLYQKYGLGPTATMTSEWKNFPFDSANLSTFWTEATYDVSDYFTPTIGGFNGSVDSKYDLMFVVIPH